MVLGEELVAVVVLVLEVTLPFPLPAVCDPLEFCVAVDVTEVWTVVVPLDTAEVVDETPVVVAVEETLPVTVCDSVCVAVWVGADVEVEVEIADAVVEAGLEDPTV